MSFDVHTLIGRRATDVSNRMSMGDVLLRAASARPDQIALIVNADASESGQCTRISYGEAADIVDRVASGFQASGLQTGDICVMVSENSAEALLTKIALARAGVVVAPLNPSLDDEVVARLFDRINPKALVADRDSLHRLTDGSTASSDLLIPYVIDIGQADESSQDVHSVSEYLTFAEFSHVHEPVVEEPEIAGDDI